MLDLKFIRSNPEKIREMLINRKYDLDMSVFESLDKDRREKLSALESLRAQRNKVSDDIAAMKKGGKVKKYAAGGLSAGHKAADGVASKGKTKAKQVKMAYGGKC